jgi:selenocysteine-specific elongation factor
LWTFPGTGDFIENMLAGVGGIDAALFVIAADEGVMPQTREHLAILDLLRIPGGVVALTKIDLIDDPDWLELVQADVSEALQGTVLDGAPIIPRLRPDRAGAGGVDAALQEVLARTPPRLDRGRPRLWIDRVFTIGGFGDGGHRYTGGRPPGGGAGGGNSAARPAGPASGACRPTRPESSGPSPEAASPLT